MGKRVPVCRLTEHTLRFADRTDYTRLPEHGVQDAVLV
jgi:hypothetical protein